MKLFWKIWGVLLAGGVFVMVVFGGTVVLSLQEMKKAHDQSLAAVQTLVDKPQKGQPAAKQGPLPDLRQLNQETRQRLLGRFVMFFIPALLAVTLMGLFTSWYITHSINKPLKGVSQALRAVAKGDLTLAVDYDFPPYGLVREADEIGRLIAQMDDMREGLARVVRDTKTNVGGVESVSDDFQKSSATLSESMSGLWQLLKDVEGSVERISTHLHFVTTNIPLAMRRTTDTVSDMGHIQSSLQEVSGATKTLDEFVDDTAGVVAEFSTTMENINQNTLSLKAQVEDSAQVITEMVDSINHASGRSDVLGRSVAKTVAAIEEMVLGLSHLKQIAEGMDESLHTTDSAMNFLTQSSVDVEDSAKSLGAAAKRSKRQAEEGGMAVQRTIEGMNTIQRTVRSASRTVRSLGDEGKKIGEIVGTVTAIAEQTNLLALNAAIEAARAGEHGKGFAVVADEVRALAEKSQRATKEIEQLISKIKHGTEDAVRSMEEGNNEVERGHALATEAGEVLGQIVDGVRQTSTLIDQIIEKTSEQNAQGENLRRAIAEVLRYGEGVREFGKKQEGGAKTMKRIMGELKDIALELKDHTTQQLQGTGRIQGSVEKLRAITQHIAGSTDQQHEGAGQMLQSIQAIKKKTAAIKNATELQTRDGDKILEASNDIKRTLEQVGVRVKDLEGDNHLLVDRTQRAFSLVQATRDGADRMHDKTQAMQKVVLGLRKSVQRFATGPGALPPPGPQATGLRPVEEGGEA